MCLEYKHNRISHDAPGHDLVRFANLESLSSACGIDMTTNLDYICYRNFQKFMVGAQLQCCSNLR